MTDQDRYLIALDAFHGPLDLLLYLIRRAEVDIHDIPIATITDEYLALLRQIDSIDVELAGDFLVMFATLVEIKSRSLVPAETTGGGDGPDEPAVDPREELVQQLLAYQKYRLAAEDLDERRVAFLRRFRLMPARDQRPREEVEPVELDLDDVHVLDLSDAYERIMETIDLSRLGDHHVEMDDTPIELHERDLLDRLERGTQPTMTLQEAFDGRSGSERVGLFLATLELTRMRRITVKQPEITDPIELSLNDDPDDALVIESDGINAAEA